MDIEERIARLEDMESIKQLKARYCEICDDGHNPDLITTIFTKDAVWEGDGIGRATGHAEIRALFEGFQKAISFSQHMVHNPIIDIDLKSSSGDGLSGDSLSGDSLSGDSQTASARWYFFGMFKYYKGDQARWQAARYHETYAKIDGEWKINHLKIAPPVMSVKYESGW